MKRRISSFSFWSISALLMLSLIATIATTTTQQAAYAQPEQDRICPEGYELERGRCYGEPTIGCFGHDEDVVNGLCVIGSMGPKPPEGCPEGYIENPNNPNNCLRVIEPFPYCVEINTQPNTEDGRCVTEPDAQYALCPPDITRSFENGYCVIQQIEICEPPSVWDPPAGSCDNPETGENTHGPPACANDLSDPALSDGCRFRPGEV